MSIPKVFFGERKLHEIHKFHDKNVTLSATMCQYLTIGMTKHVSFYFFAWLVSFFSSLAFAQNEQVSGSAKAVGMADPTPELQPGMNAVLEQDVADRELVVNPDANKLEEIDEASVTYEDEGQDEAAEGQVQTETTTPLSEEVEDLKKAALELNRDLLILEEELLFPANSQIVVFLSLDVGEYFALDSVKVLIDDNLVASHLYTKRQNTALSLGGIQRLYLGNLKSGDHEVTAFFVGMGPDNREYKRGATIVIEKDDDPKLLELKVRDSTANMQPEFEFEEWQL